MGRFASRKRYSSRRRSRRRSNSYSMKRRSRRRSHSNSYSKKRRSRSHSDKWSSKKHTHITYWNNNDARVSNYLPAPKPVNIYNPPPAPKPVNIYKPTPPNDNKGTIYTFSKKPAAEPKKGVVKPKPAGESFLDKVKKFFVSSSKPIDTIKESSEAEIAHHKWLQKQQELYSDSQKEQTAVIQNIKPSEIIHAYEIDKNKSENNNECCICFNDMVKRFGIFPCGHAKYCENCIKQLKICAICKTNIDKYMPIYVN